MTDTVKRLLITFTILITVTALILTFYTIFPAKHLDKVKKYSKEYGIDFHLVLSLIKAESNFSENAVSGAGARGIMQLTEDTFYHCAHLMGLDDEKPDINSTDTNIRVGVWYFSTLMKKYSGNTINAVAAYNAGPGNVDKWLLDNSFSKDGKTLFKIPFAETCRHVKKVKNYTRFYKLLYF